MTAAARSRASDDIVPTLNVAQRLLVFAGTILVIIALAVLPLLTPWFIHPALDAAAAAERLGVEPAVAHGISDRSVEALLLGGSFDIAGPDGTPLFDADERRHLGDARTLLWLCLAAGAVSFVAISVFIARGAGGARATTWRMVSLAGLAGVASVLLLGLASVIAFGTLFTLFHEIFFPSGNFSFDPATQRLVQLYPFRFWQIAAAGLGGLVLLLSAGAWWLGRTMARRAQPRVDGRKAPE